jgi:hypothetical protein
LNDLQITAGLKFKAGYHAAAISAYVAGSYSGMSNAKDFFRMEHERSDAEEAAVRELGLRYSSAVIATVCYDAPPLPRDLSALQNGLELLAALYHLGKGS